MERVIVKMLWLWIYLIYLEVATALIVHYSRNKYLEKALLRRVLVLSIWIIAAPKWGSFYHQTVLFEGRGETPLPTSLAFRTKISLFGNSGWQRHVVGALAPTRLKLVTVALSGNVRNLGTILSQCIVHFVSAVLRHCLAWALSRSPWFLSSSSLGLSRHVR